MNKTIHLIQNGIILILLFLVPVAFLNITPEYFHTTKFYLVALGVLSILSLSTLNFVLSRTLILHRSPFERALSLIAIVSLITLVVAAPNKVQSAISLPTGFFSILSLIIFSTLLASRVNSKTWGTIRDIFFASAFLLAVVYLISYLNPLENAALPTTLEFLKSSSFTPIGTQYSLVVFLGFFVILSISSLYYLGIRLPGKSSSLLGSKSQTSEKHSLFHLLVFMVIGIAVVAGIFAIAAPTMVGHEKAKFPPIITSWQTSVETLKNPTSAIIGVSPDNFIVVFNKVKPPQYNLTDLWEVSFNTASSFAMQIWVEMGTLGLVAMLILLVYISKTLLKARDKKNLELKILTPAMIYLMAIIMILPITYPLLFLFFSAIGIVSGLSGEGEDYVVKLEKKPLVWAASSLAMFVLLALGFYGLGRSYASQIYYKQSVDALQKNQGQVVYTKLVKAIQANPYNENFYSTFAQVNLLIANNLASKENVTDEDRKIISQAIQQSINSAKAAIKLNPLKSIYWENLASIYRNILNVAQGADAWTIAAYQKAIQADPNNPKLRVALGGVYYTLANYDQAITTFRQAVALKPDLANAYYNLAWAYYQAGDYKQAVQSMQNVLALLPEGSSDLEKAQQDYKLFATKVSEEPKADKNLPPRPNSSESQTPLSNPAGNEPVISPKIELPANAAPAVTVGPEEETGGTRLSQ